jgi:hypothetical protein
MRKEFGRDAAAGKSGAEMTDWVRSMERPLMNSKAFLGESDECTGLMSSIQKTERRLLKTSGLRLQTHAQPMHVQFLPDRCRGMRSRPLNAAIAVTGRELVCELPPNRA